MNAKMNDGPTPTSRLPKISGALAILFTLAALLLTLLGDPHPDTAGQIAARNQQLNLGLVAWVAAGALWGLAIISSALSQPRSRDRQQLPPLLQALIGILPLLLLAWLIGSSILAPSHEDDIWAAMTRGDSAAVQRLVRDHSGMSGSLEEQVVLWSLERGDTELLRLLLDRGLDPNREVQYAPLLVHAIRRGDPALVRLLLSYGASPTQPDRDLTTPLEHAAQLQNPEILRLLKEHAR